MPTEGDEDYILGTGSLGLLKNHTNGDINDITIEMIAAERAFHQYLKWYSDVKLIRYEEIGIGSLMNDY